MESIGKNLKVVCWLTQVVSQQVLGQLLVVLQASLVLFRIGLVVCCTGSIVCWSSTVQYSSALAQRFVFLYFRSETFIFISFLAAVLVKSVIKNLAVSGLFCIT